MPVWSSKQLLMGKRRPHAGLFGVHKQVQVLPSYRRTHQDPTTGQRQHIVTQKQRKHRMREKQLRLLGHRHGHA